MDNNYYVTIIMELNNNYKEVEKELFEEIPPFAKLKFQTSNLLEITYYLTNVTDKNATIKYLTKFLSNRKTCNLKNLELESTDEDTYPDELYLYRTWRKRYNYTKKIIKNSQLHFSNPETFNDPFDSNLQIELVANEPIDSFKNKIGICCLSAKGNKILMWSHYADKHNGICLKFDAKKLRNSLGLKEGKPTSILKVIYDEEYPKKTDDLQLKVKKFFSYKHKDWNYEEEYRLIRGEAINENISFSPEALIGVIFGCKTSIEVKDELTKIVHRLNKNRQVLIKLYEAQMSSGKFELDIVPYND